MKKCVESRLSGAQILPYLIMMDCCLASAPSSPVTVCIGLTEGIRSLGDIFWVKGRYSFEELSVRLNLQCFYFYLQLRTAMKTFCLVPWQTALVEQSHLRCTLLKVLCEAQDIRRIASKLYSSILQETSANTGRFALVGGYPELYT